MGVEKSQLGLYTSILCPQKTPDSVHPIAIRLTPAPNLSDQVLVPRGHLDKCAQEIESIPDTVTSVHHLDSSLLGRAEAQGGPLCRAPQSFGAPPRRGV